MAGAEVKAFRAEPVADPLLRTLLEAACAVAERKRRERAERRARLAIVEDPR